MCKTEGMGSMDKVEVEEDTFSEATFAGVDMAERFILKRNHRD